MKRTHKNNPQVAAPVRGELFVVSAPSGAGKTTILKRVLAHLHGVTYSVSHTTRPPRPGEVDGRDYHFVTHEEFRELIEKGAFLEWAQVHTDLYGTSREEVEQAVQRGEDVVLDIDVQGARSIRENYHGGVFIFIVPPSMEELERRLKKRGTETEATIHVRLENARRELEAMVEYDYIVVNDDLDLAVEVVKSIFLAERARRERVLPLVQAMLGLSLQS